MSWTDSMLFLRKLVVAFRTFLWPSYKFLTELDANTLLLQHIQFTIGRRDKHDCAVDQRTHDWVKLPLTPLVRGVRRCCQVSYTVVTKILLVVSLSKNFVLDIFYQTSYIFILNVSNNLHRMEIPYWHRINIMRLLYFQRHLIVYFTLLTVSTN
jgi:hypothetical protein